MNTLNHKNNPTLALFSLKLFIEKIKGYDVIFTFKDEENGNISGTYKGVKKMSQSNKKITNQDIMNSIMSLGKRIDDMEIKFEKRFEDIDKRFEDLETKFEKRFDKIDAKIDLIIACPTIQSEIDQDALAKIDAR